MEVSKMHGTIIVPLPGPGIDPDLVSERSIPLARALSDRTGAPLLLMSVVDIPALHHDLSEQLALLPSEINHVSRQQRERIYHLREQAIADRTAYLRDVAQRCPGADVEILIRYGNAAEAIVDVARSLDQPVIVLATHCHSGVLRSVLGSIAGKVVQTSPCPVLVARTTTPNGRREPPRLQRLLVPLDGSSLSELGLWSGLPALGRQALEVILLRIADADEIRSTFDLFTGLEHQPELERYLASLAQDVERLGHRVSWQVETGSPAEEIHRVAAARGVDAIVMATHGRSGVSRLIFGSVAEGVLHDCTVPVLLVPAASAGPHALHIGPHGSALAGLG
jgi:nucleotide-binding universal stress UspA family protein